MRLWRAYGMVGLTVSCLTWGVALGQTKSGEFSKPWSVSVRIGEEYSDNRDGTATNKQSNWDGIVAPRASVLYRDADRTSVRLTLAPVLKWHSNPRSAAEGGGEGQRDTDLFGSGGVEAMHRATPAVTLTAGDQVTYSDDPQIIESGITVRRSESYILNAAHAGVDAELSAQAGVGVETKSVSTRYEDDIVARKTDSDLFSGEVTPRYVVGSGWTVIGLVGVSRFQEEQAEPNRAADTFTLDAGLAKSVTPDCVVKVMGGYQGVEYEDPELASAHTMNGSADVIFNADAPTRFRLGATYGYAPPSLSSHSAQTATTLSGTLDHDVVADRLTVSLAGQYRDSEYEREGPEAPGGSEQMTRFGLHGTYYMSPGWSLKGGYAFEDWESELSESFKRNLVDFSIGLEW